MPHLPYDMSWKVHDLSSVVGLPADQMLFLMFAFAAVPLGIIQSLLPRSAVTLKHCYSIFFGTIFLYGMFGLAALNPVLTCVATYFLVQVLPKKNMPLVITGLAMAYLSAAHLYRMFVDWGGWRIDFTGSQMIFTVKLCTFAFNYDDGLKLVRGEKLGEKEHLHKFRAERAITKLPSVLEYASYMLFYGGVLSGPCFEIREYLNFIDFSVFKKNGLDRIPSTIVPALIAVSRSLVAFVLSVMSMQLPLVGVVETAEFQTNNYAYRILYVWLSVTLWRAKYHAAWHLADAACIASGFGLKEARKTPEGKLEIDWTRCKNINSRSVEFGRSLPALTNNWNTSVNNWLKNYVYFRVIPVVGSKSTANLITKFVSAFWHGFYPAYYIFFLIAGFFAEVDSGLRALYRPFFVRHTPSGEKVYNVALLNFHRVVSWLLTQWSLAFIGISFVILRVDTTVLIWKQFHYHVLVGAFFLIAVFRIMNRRQKVHKFHEKDTTKHFHLHSSETATKTKPSPVTAAAPVAVAATNGGGLQRRRSKRAD